MAAEEKPGTKPKEQRLTCAGLPPDEHARRMASRARENAKNIPAEYREDVQRYRLRVVDDDVDAENLYAYESSRFTDPDAAVELVREDYYGEYLVGIYEIEPVYLRYPGDREQTVPLGEPLGGEEALWAVGYVRDYRDTSGHWCGEAVSVTDYTDRASAEKLLASVKNSDPDFDGYFLLPDRNEPEDEPEEPDVDDDPFYDGTIGYDYYGPSWATRDI